MRRLQLTYWLEPAGSHGIWGLDDYHFLPFLWGAAQLVGHRFVRPRGIHDADIVEALAPQYMYFDCVRYVNSVRAHARTRTHTERHRERRTPRPGRHPHETTACPKSLRLTRWVCGGVRAGEDGVAGVALAHAERHKRGQDVGQGRVGPGQDVCGRGASADPIVSLAAGVGDD
jgi:hypothetical protein